MNQYEMKQIAYQSTLKSRALQVLVYLIDRSNKEGTCFPAISTMSRELHISVSTVKRALRELTESGFVKKESRFREKNNGQTSNLYILCFLEKQEEKTGTELKRVEEKKTVDTDVDSWIERQGKHKVINTIGFITYHTSFDESWGNSFPIKNVNSFCDSFCWPGERVSLIPP